MQQEKRVQETLRTLKRNVRTSPSVADKLTAQIVLRSFIKALDRGDLTFIESVVTANGFSPISSEDIARSMLGYAKQCEI